jgi:hypothetical protein
VSVEFTPIASRVRLVIGKENSTPTTAGSKVSANRIAFNLSEVPDWLISGGGR